MFFYGDIALPGKEYIPAGLLNTSTEIGVANLEGPIIEESNIKERKLFNDDSVLDLLNRLNIKIVSLANNHITDFGFDVTYTKSLLKKNGIAYCGYGMNIEEARQPALYIENNIQYAFLAFGWNVTGCIYATQDSPGVNPLTKQNLLACLKDVKARYPKSRIIVMIHWGIELERYPEPLHRSLAACAINNGADFIVGHHSHCLQGWEVYQDKYIFYGLGNCLIPNGTFWNGKLKYPEYAREQLCIKWSLNEVPKCLFYSYDTEEKRFVKKVCKIICYNSYSDKEIKEYNVWFRKNRVKKKGIPVFIDSGNGEGWNKLKYRYLKFRGRIIILLKILRRTL